MSLVEFVGTGGTTDEFEYMLVSTVGSVATDGFYEVWGGPVGMVMEISGGSNWLGITLTLWSYFPLGRVLEAEEGDTRLRHKEQKWEILK